MANLSKAVALRAGSPYVQREAERLGIVIPVGNLEWTRPQPRQSVASGRDEYAPPRHTDIAHGCETVRQRH